MQILENEKEWGRHYQDAVLQLYHETGVFSFEGYAYADNHNAPQGRRVDLTSTRLLFISSSGAFISRKQSPFKAEDPLGDYSLRKIPVSTPLAHLDFAHAHYDQSAVREDPQTLLPLKLLQEKVENDELDGLTDHWVSFMGYQPDLTRVVHETIPPILSIAEAEKANAAFLVPA